MIKKLKPARTDEIEEGEVSDDPMTDEETLELYRTVIAHICLLNGGGFVLDEMPQHIYEKLTRPGSIMSRALASGGVEFRYVEDLDPSEMTMQ